MAITYGRKIEFGVKDPLPLRGFPPGRARIRQRNDAFTVVFIRPEDGGVRRFYVEERDGAWWPAIESGANRNASNAEGQGCRASRHTLDPLVGASGSPKES